MRAQILNAIYQALDVINDTLAHPLPLNEKENCPLYATGGLDSISLVSLNSLVEQNIEDTFDQSIILANEKAMSAKNSPFLTVGRLADYILYLLVLRFETLLKHYLNQLRDSASEQKKNRYNYF